MKRAVVYYSLEGHTRAVAEQLAQAVEADLLELKIKHEIPTRGFMKFIIGGAQICFGYRPRILNDLQVISQYDEILLGTPIWAGKPAPLIHTFLQTCTYQNRIHGLFTTSGGGDDSTCYRKMKQRLPQLQWHLAIQWREAGLSTEAKEKIRVFGEEIQRGN